MVDLVYKAPGALSSSTVWLGILAYSVQILCDFSGYTDMARGIAKMLGFELPKNFNSPYTAQSITEFWQRWHISLSTWLRDYLYIPLGGNRKGKIRTYFNLMITMLLGGLWHGASWNFVLWGGLHGIFLALERLIFGKRPPLDTWEKPVTWLRATFTFLLVSIAWVPFRSPDWMTTLVVFKKLLFLGGQNHLEYFYIWAVLLVPLVVIGSFIVRRFDWDWPLYSIQEVQTPAFILIQVLIVYFYAPLNSSPFIYFQF
jgi:alginate O-acetyltransferase complex protein AlgI